MGFWDQQGRPAIMAAVEAACDAVAENLAIEMRERDQTRHTFLAEEVERLKAGAARATELESENKALTRELQELRESLKLSLPIAAVDSSSDHPDALPTPRATLPGRQGTRQPLGELPVNTAPAPIQVTKPLGTDPSILAKEYAKLLKVYTSLEKKLEAKRVAAGIVIDQRNSWIKYAESLEAKLKRLEQRLKTQEKKDVAIHTTTGEELGNALPSFASSFMSNPEQSSGTGLHQNAVEELRQSKRAASTPATLVEHTTAPEQEVLVPHLGEEETWSGNEPERPDDLPHLPSTLDVENQVKVKQEPSSDGPVVVSERRLHKRKGVENGFRLPPARRVKAEHDGSSDPVITGEFAAFSPHSSIDLDAGQGEVMTPRKSRHLDIATRISNPLTERRREPLREISIEARDAFPTPIPSDSRSDRRSSTTSSRRTSTAHDWTLENGVADLAEDRPLVPQHTSSNTGRLQGLLNHGPSEGDVVVPLRTPSSRENPRQATSTTRVQRSAKVRKDLPTPVRTPLASATVQSVSKLRLETTADTRTPQQRPLRERPVSELRIEDFKINPKSNNGHKHAFNEVVRNKAERAELEGCTDPNCCGRAFAAMAESDLKNGGPDLLKKSENIKLLENHLGDEAYRLVSMTTEEKKELFLEAKALDYANRMGRHRHRYGRPPSPPGYWNPDFPSTQEIEERRKEGEKMERKMVEERRREAMRSGGRWLFRDE